MRSYCGTRPGQSRGLKAVDTLVLLVVLIFFVALLAPVLTRAQDEAFTDVCASHLASIGKAMLIYANDYNDAFPRGGGPGSCWGRVTWDAPTRNLAYGIADPNASTAGRGRGTGAGGGRFSVSSCFYLLVKYAELDPNQFVCPEDPNVSIFTLAEEPNNPVPIMELTHAWNFGANPTTHCSYAYHAPWGAYALKMSDDPNRAVAADRSPYIASPGVSTPRTFFDPNDPAVVFGGKAGSEACQKYGNSTVHRGEGQNVLFVDSHVGFETRPYCSVSEDNIYTRSAFIDRGDPVGLIPVVSAWGVVPLTRKDSVLVHDPPTWPN